MASTNGDSWSSHRTEMFHPSPSSSLVQCGTPFAPHTVVLDFAAGAQDHSQAENKCQQFWKFVSQHPELDQIKITPDMTAFKWEHRLSQATDQPTQTASDLFTLREPNCLETLGAVQDSGIIKSAMPLISSGKKRTCEPELAGSSSHQTLGEVGKSERDLDLLKLEVTAAPHTINMYTECTYLDMH